MEIEKLLKELTAAEKAALVAGTKSMFTNRVPRLGIPSIEMSDGPHGLRKQLEGKSTSEPATAFPTAVTTASGWDTENVRAMGEAIAEECNYYGVELLLGPALNIKRNPRCGRNFEYFSEDPLLAGKMAAAMVRGAEGGGVRTCVKHFALNNSEDFRFMGDSVADERAMREIYLKAFEYALKEGKPAAVMCAYNKVNGTYCSRNGNLLNGILREEWGFDGAVMTDWGAMEDRVEALKAGLDLEMPGDTAYCRKRIVDGLKDKSLPLSALDGAVANVLRLVERAKRGGKAGEADFASHHALAGRIARECAVLMKNDGVLPLSDEPLFVTGGLFEKMRYQGAGSSAINPTAVTTPKAAFDARGVRYAYQCGYLTEESAVDDALIREAVEGARDYRTILVFAGLTDNVESEGCDRQSLALPENQLALIDAMKRTGKRVVVILYGGAVVELPFAEEVNAILNMFLPGQNGGTATAELLFGDYSPSGRLSESWVKSYDCVPFGGEYAVCARDIYRESVFVGYRYYTGVKGKVRYPFGFGLSYTQFSYSDFVVSQRGEAIEAECTVKNIGKRDGAEVVQIYVAPPAGGAVRPVRELKAFTKLFLLAGEAQRVRLKMDIESLKYFDIPEKRWILVGGEYCFILASDCETPIEEVRLALKGEAGKPVPTDVRAAYTGELAVSDALFERMSGLKILPLPPVKPITMESRFTDLRNTFFGRILYRAVMHIPEKELKRAKKMPKGSARDVAVKNALFLKRMLESGCLRSMSMASGGKLSYHVAEGMKELSNGHLFKALGKFLKRIKAPRL